MGVMAKKDDRNRGGLPRGTANGEPYFIPGLSPETPRSGGLPPGTANGEPYVIPAIDKRMIPMEGAVAVKTLNDALGAQARKPAGLSNEEIAEGPELVEEDDRKQPPRDTGSPTDVTDMNPQDWRRLQHVQNVMKDMPGNVARHFQFRSPDELMTDPEFSQWEGMSPDERFLRGALMNQIRSQTLQQRQAGLHGLSPHQFSGFGGANDGTSAAFYRAVPRTVANPEVVRTARQGADQNVMNTLRGIIAMGNEQRMGDDPRRNMMALIMQGKTPDEAAEIMQQVFGGGVPMGGGFNGVPGATQSGAPFTDTPKAQERAQSMMALQRVAKSPTMAELLGPKPPQEFDTSDLYAAYKKWLSGDLNDGDISMLSSFVRARDAAGIPLNVPNGILYNAQEQSALRGWLEGLKTGTVDAMGLQQSVDSGVQQGNDQNARRWNPIFDFLGRSTAIVE